MSQRLVSFVSLKFETATILRFSHPRFLSSDIGFPTGGDQISVTRGVVSRITHDADSLLRVQIDAAINPVRR